jgi:hypothetical protein
MDVLRVLGVERSPSPVGRLTGFGASEVAAALRYRLRDPDDGINDFRTNLDPGGVQGGGYQQPPPAARCRTISRPAASTRRFAGLQDPA